jgi:hypothetical protein
MTEDQIAKFRLDASLVWPRVDELALGRLLGEREALLDALRGVRGLVGPACLCSEKGDAKSAAEILHNAIGAIDRAIAKAVAQ